MTESISSEESFEYSLRCFLDWLEILTMQPVELCNTWGDYNVAWELLSDLRSDGSSAHSSVSSYLSEQQKHEVRVFLQSLDLIPKSLLAQATSASANLEAMSHPCWIPYRKTASGLLKILEPAALRNRLYFSSL